MRQLARVHGLSLSFEDGFRRRRRVSDDVLEGVLRGLDVDPRDPGRALRAAVEERWSALCDPVAVAWGGRLELVVRVPASERGSIGVTIDCEAGETFEERLSRAHLPIEERFDGARESVVSRRLRFPHRLPGGYHRATIRLGRRSAEVLVISAPRRAPVPGPGAREFGVVAPLYSLRSSHGHGIADLGDLRRLLDWTGRHGGAFVGTLPLLAGFLDEPAEISPYRPVSRLAWNELYLELPAIPEWNASAAGATVPDPTGSSEARRLGRSMLADPAAVYALKQPAIEALARRAFGVRGGRRAALEAFEAERPEIAAYARFRAAEPELGRRWRDWPAGARGGSLRGADVRHDRYEFHLYAQLVMHEQLEALSSPGEGAQPGLYLDLPLGAHPDGFDTWRDPDSFAMELGVGAPPDRLFEGGQSWGFPPQHPRRARQLGYRHFIEVIRNHLRYARMLRIDHVMGLHRLYVIPPGGEARDGTYLRFEAEELWAILVLEATRAGAILVGEDLGTVPRAVRSAMRRHGAGGMHVLEFAIRPDATPAVVSPPTGSLASLSTHDLSPFPGWLVGEDIRTRRRIGLIDSGAEAEAVRRRERDVRTLRRLLGLAADAAASEVVLASLDHLGSSDAALVAVSLDELDGRVDAQNVPGTGDEHPNWRRRVETRRDTLESPRVVGAMSALASARRGGG
jgi:4-alpha-glucanotransferase